MACLKSNFALNGHPCKNDTSTSELVDNVDVFYMKAKQSLSESEIQDVLTFVENGGGLIISGQAWSWIKYSNDGELPYSVGFPGNK